MNAAHRLPLLVNPSAGGAGDAVAPIRAALAAAGVDADVVAIGPACDDALRELVDARVPLVGVAGGDGTVRRAARRVAGSDSALAVFPAGTLNHFSRSIAIDSLETAAAAVAGGCVETIAVAFAGDEPFLNTATFGLYADVVRRRERMRRWIGKWPAAAIAFAVTIARYRPLRMTIEEVGRQHERSTSLVAVGVSRRSFPVREVPLRLEREPELIVSILRANTRSGLLGTGTRTALRLLGREIPEDKDAELHRTTGFTLATASRRLGVTLDGDIVPVSNPVDVRIRRDILRVIVPRRPAAGEPLG